MPAERELAWVAADGGREALRLRAGPDGVRAESTLEIRSRGAPVQARYVLECDAAWRTRSLRVEVDGPDGARSLRLERDGRGAWSDADGPRPDLDGATDVDLSATPFTNTLPLRRLALRRRQAADVTAVQVGLPGLEVGRVTQRYTCLRPGRAYRFEQPGLRFARDILVDDDLLVVSYPGLFRRA